jgi:hypothetical protein
VSGNSLAAERSRSTSAIGKGSFFICRSEV